MKEDSLALDYMNKAIEVARANNFERDLIQIEVNKTNLLVAMNQYDEALNIVKNAIKFYKKAKDQHQLIWVYRIMVNIYYLQKDYKRSYETQKKLDSITDDYIADVQKCETDKNIDRVKVQETLDSEKDLSSYRNSKQNNYHGFIGCSKAYHNVLNSALLAAQYQNTSVLILGESGTGKEIIA